MGASVNVKVDLKGLEKKCSPEAVRRGQIAMTDQMLLDMNKFVPMRSGKLRESGHARVDTLTWSTKYARIRFYNRRLKLFFSEKQRKFFFAKKDELLAKKPKPGTGPRWDRKAAAKYKKDWGKVAIKAMGVK